MNKPEPSVADAAAYAALISDICKLSPHGGLDNTSLLEQRVFQRLGFDTQFRMGYQVRKKGDDIWSDQPKILTDFGTAVRYTIGSRHGTLEHPLESNWYVMDMYETAEQNPFCVTRSKIAAWAVEIARQNKGSSKATAITPAAALVAAWLRAHP